MVSEELYNLPYKLRTGKDSFLVYSDISTISAGMFNKHKTREEQYSLKFIFCAKRLCDVTIQGTLELRRS